MARQGELVVGINAVTTRLRRGDGLVRLILREGGASRRLHEIEELARTRRCPIERQPQAWFDRATSLAHQGVALMIETGEVKSESHLDALVARASGSLLLLVFPTSNKHYYLMIQLLLSHLLYLFLMNPYISILKLSHYPLIKFLYLYYPHYH